ncbi:MAG: hypothetical protein NWE83_04365 [Candidatus Bathyarchaeota archaeon]|nr:hypothetical protein [Candidatus Bathyarchaeota archaeon]
MAQLATFCKGCCFYNQEEKCCETGYLDKFKECGSKIEWTEDGPVILRVCPSRRPLDWEHKDDADIMNRLRDEMFIYGSVLVIAKSTEGLITTIDRLSETPNIHKFNIVVVYQDGLKGIGQLCQEKITFTDFVSVRSYLDEINEVVFDASRRAKNGYLITLDSEKDFDVNMLNVLNSAVNNKLKKVLHVVGTDGLHQSATMCLLYKWLKGNLMVDMASKIQEMARTQNLESQVFTWGELHA